MKHGKSFVTNEMIDNVIENIGPEAVEKIGSGVDKAALVVDFKYKLNGEILKSFMKDNTFFVAFEGQ